MAPACADVTVGTLPLKRFSVETTGAASEVGYYGRYREPPREGRFSALGKTELHPAWSQTR
jgi:hypothetical protein